MYPLSLVILTNYKNDYYIRIQQEMSIEAPSFTITISNKLNPEDFPRFNIETTPYKYNNTWNAGIVEYLNCSDVINDIIGARKAIRKNILTSYPMINHVRIGPVCWGRGAVLLYTVELWHYTFTATDELVMNDIDNMVDSLQPKLTANKTLTDNTKLSFGWDKECVIHLPSANFANSTDITDFGDTYDKLIEYYNELSTARYEELRRLQEQLKEHQSAVREAVSTLIETT